LGASKLVDLQIRLSTLSSSGVMDVITRAISNDPDAHVRKFAASAGARWAAKLSEHAGSGEAGLDLPD